jgi:hypothetical protein
MIEEGRFVSHGGSLQSQSTLANRQSNRHSTIQSPITNRQSVNRQSATGNRQ